MEDWIASAVNTLLGPLRAGVDAITKRVATVWSVITTFLTAVRKQVASIRAGVASWADRQLAHARAVATTLKWIVTTYIPRKLDQLATAIRTWTADLIVKAEVKARSLFDGLMQWATDRLKSLLGLLDSLRTWAITQVNGLLDTVGRIAKLVFGPLANPERLAAWAIDAIVSAAIKWGETNLHRLEALLAAKRDFIWKLVITVIEDVLHDIL